MHYADILHETIDTHQIYRVIKVALQRTLTHCAETFGFDEDDEYVSPDDYYNEIREAVRIPLEKLLYLRQDKTKPVQLIFDFLGGYQPGTLGFFRHDETTGYIHIELNRLLYTTDDVLDVRNTADAVAKVFAHEFTHYKQRLRFWDVDEPREVSRRIQQTPIVDDGGREKSNEIQAHAADAARQIVTYAGNPLAALRLLRSEAGIKDVDAVSSSFHGYVRLRNQPGGALVFRRFLHHLVRQIDLLQPKPRNI